MALDLDQKLRVAPKFLAEANSAAVTEKGAGDICKERKTGDEELNKKKKKKKKREAKGGKSGFERKKVGVGVGGRKPSHAIRSQEMSTTCPHSCRASLRAAFAI